MSKILIVDDEEHVRDELSYIISSIPDFQLLPAASSGTQALKILTQDKPAILLLDIEMPGLNGIEIGNFIKDMQSPPYLVYVTAYDHYALDAFKVNAVGYILKPISSKNVKAKLDMIKKMIQTSEHEDDQISHHLSKPNRISYRIGEKYVFLNNPIFFLHMQRIVKFSCASAAKTIHIISR